ncbi:MAG: hypothetical protein U0840_16815 [Gemmataceae bacterium]
MSASLALCACLALAPGAAPAPAGPWLIEFGLTGDQLQARATQLQKAGYRPSGVTGYNDGEFPRFAVIWEKGAGPAWRLDFGLTPAQFDRRATQLKADGFRPVALSGYDLGGTQGFIDIWRKTDGPAYEVNYGTSGDGLGRLALSMKERGYRPTHLSSYVSGTVSRYATLWEKGGDEVWDLKWGLTTGQLDDSLNQMPLAGYRPVALTALVVEEITNFSMIWSKRKGPPWLVRYNLDGDGLLDLARTQRGRGYRPIHLSGYGTLGGIRFTTIWEQTPMK